MQERILKQRDDFIYLCIVYLANNLNIITYEIDSRKLIFCFLHIIISFNI